MTEEKYTLKVTEAEGSEANALLDFPVRMLHTKVQLPDGEVQTVPNRFAIYRTDTNKFLGSMSDRYKMVPHLDAKRAVDKVLFEEGLNFTSKTQLVGEGERLYINYDFPDFKEDLNGMGDNVNFRVILQNSMDGRKKFGLIHGAVRFVCSNGMVAFGKQGGTVTSKKHVSTLDLDVIMADLKHGIQRFKTQLIPFYRGLADVKLTTDEGIAKIKDLVEKDKVIAKKYQSHIESLWTSPIRDEDSGRDLWSLYNAFTDASTHELGSGSLERGHEADQKIANAFRSMLVGA